MLPHVFDLFAQAEVGRAQGGLGIGLAVVRRLVELHGGRIEARSEGLGKGSEFIVGLASVSPAEQWQAKAAPAAPPRRARILVVEDNAEAADALEMLLELLGHEVDVVHDGPSALAAAHAKMPGRIRSASGVFGDLRRPRYGPPWCPSGVTPCRRRRK